MKNRSLKPGSSGQPCLAAFTQNAIYSLNKDNTLYKVLNGNTKTTPIMDEFYYSDKKFLVFYDVLLYYFECFYDVHFILTKYVKDLKTANINPPTLTELKRSSGKAVISNQFPDRMLPVINHIQAICNQNNPNDQEKIIIPFDTPFPIGGQTFNDQEGYGCEWIGGGDYIEGTLYGQTTSFLIGGIIIQKSQY